MKLSPKAISDTVVAHMRKNSLNVMTMRWQMFYGFCARDRLKEGFLASLSDHLKTESIMFVQGHSVVAFVNDFDFSPMKK